MMDETDESVLYPAHTKKDRKAKKKKETFQNRTAQSIIKPNQIENKKKNGNLEEKHPIKTGMVWYFIHSSFFFQIHARK